MKRTALIWAGANDALSFTLSGDEALEIDGDGHPHGLPVLLRTEAPHAHTHGLGARLRRQAGEEERLLSEVIRLPAPAFVSGEPDERTLFQSKPKLLLVYG